MIREFSAHDFALADDLKVSLGGGLNVITGETGSGKSVLVNAINLLLGGKASGAMVRSGAEKASLEAVFDWEPPADALAALNEAGIAVEDGELIIQREISENGRSTARLNSRAASAALLRSVGERLADIHGQYDHQAILRGRDHTRFLDALGSDSHRSLVREAASLRRSLNSLTSEKDSVESQRRKREDERDLLLFRINEIESVVKSEEEHAEAEREARLLERASELAEAASNAFSMVGRDSNETSALNLIASALGELDNLEGVEPRLDAAREKLLEADALADAAARILRDLSDEIEADPERLRGLQDRLLETRDLMKKNRCDGVGGLLSARDAARSRVAELDRSDASGAELDEAIKKTRSQLSEKSAKLTECRKKTAATFEKQMKKELGELAMKGASFEVEFRSALDEDGVPSASGAETAEFLFSANPGEPARPLGDVASGGEMSRVMLAFKTLLNRCDDAPTLIFDEIDSGVGGLTANAIGKKLAALAKDRQVVAVTHLPQIAAFADTHVAVSKEGRGGRTVMRASIARGEDRLREICRMLGDSGVRDASASMARQMIDDAERDKSDGDSKKTPARECAKK